MARVVLAMSGGVDSSAAAWLLREAGHEVIGVFMRHGEKAQEACAVEGPPGFQLPIFRPRGGHKQGCCSAEDAEDARSVADQLDIPFYALNLEAEFRRIIDYFVDEYTRGRTPNPCVQCNHWLKFGKLFDYADSVGAEYVATGHYAQLVPLAGPHVPRQQPCATGAGDDVAGDLGATCVAGAAQAAGAEAPPLALVRGVDARKDQSYVLFGIPRHRLRRMLLPVGGYHKAQIRQIAARLGLRVAEKKDSQDICFVTQGRHDEFVRQRRAGVDRSGLIVTTSGRVVGRHAGIERFTVGQRKGLGVALGEPYFVVRIEPQTRQVVIGRKEELARESLWATGCNWLVDPPEQPFSCQAQIRYNSPPVPAVAEVQPEGRLRVRFVEPCYGVAPGQAVVLYEGARVLGGGWID
jgi:tRNA-specific 2-thiouridylase